MNEDGYAKLRLSPREMVPGKYVSKTLTKKDMEAILEISVTRTMKVRYNKPVKLVFTDASMEE